MKKLNKKAGEIIIFVAFFVVWICVVTGVAIKESVNPSPPRPDIQTMVQNALKREIEIRKAQETNNVTKR